MNTPKKRVENKINKILEQIEMLPRCKYKLSVCESDKIQALIGAALKTALTEIVKTKEFKL